MNRCEPLRERRRFTPRWVKNDNLYLNFLVVQALVKIMVAWRVAVRRPVHKLGKITRRSHVDTKIPDSGSGCRLPSFSACKARSRCFDAVRKAACRDVSGARQINGCHSSPLLAPCVMFQMHARINRHPICLSRLKAYDSWRGINWRTHVN